MMDASQLAAFVIKHWTEITGLSRSYMYEEGEFNEVVSGLCQAHGVDIRNFSDAFNDALEGS